MLAIANELFGGAMQMSERKVIPFSLVERQSIEMPLFIVQAEDRLHGLALVPDDIKLPEVDLPEVAKQLEVLETIVPAACRAGKIKMGDRRIRYTVIDRGVVEVCVHEKDRAVREEWFRGIDDYDIATSPQAAEYLLEGKIGDRSNFILDDVLVAVSKSWAGCKVTFIYSRPDKGKGLHCLLEYSRKNDGEEIASCETWLHREGMRVKREWSGLTHEERIVMRPFGEIGCKTLEPDWFNESIL